MKYMIRLFTIKNSVYPASLAKDVPVIGMNGFSKAHMSTGWLRVSIFL
jgi:aspartate/methionine/tyrosine aminotransferase